MTFTWFSRFEKKITGSELSGHAEFSSQFLVNASCKSHLPFLSLGNTQLSAEVASDSPQIFLSMDGIIESD
jgi:hypothetical protein